MIRRDYRTAYKSRMYWALTAALVFAVAILGGIVFGQPWNW